MLKSISSWAEAVLKPGSHSSSLNPTNYENGFAVDKLVVKLFEERHTYVDQVEAEKAETALQQQRKKDMCNFLVPPPPGLVTHNI